MMRFADWLDTLIEEKGITGETVTVTGPSGPNHIPLECLTDAIKAAPHHEQQHIKATLVHIDFANGDVMHYFRHLAQAIAI